MVSFRHIIVNTLHKGDNKDDDDDDMILLLVLLLLIIIINNFRHNVTTLGINTYTHRRV